MSTDTIKTPAPLTETLNELYASFRAVDEGRVADYIPELAHANPDRFGIAVANTRGDVFEYGDSAESFTIQSISKPFVYGLALEDHGRDFVLSRVGVEPSGEAFNSIVLDQLSHRPFNPMINTGAIVTTDLVKGDNYAERISRTIEMFGRFAGREVFVDSAVFMSERATGHRNRAIAHLMLSFGMLSANLGTVRYLFEADDGATRRGRVAIGGECLAMTDWEVTVDSRKTDRSRTGARIISHAEIGVA